VSRRGQKWAVVGASLVLILLGIHLAWERHRYRLETPKGVIRIGMTPEQVWAVLGPDGYKSRPHTLTWAFGRDSVHVDFYPGGRVSSASFNPLSGPMSHIPCPSLFQHVRSWFTGQREE
jgi:hypothetical protein